MSNEIKCSHKFHDIDGCNAEVLSDKELTDIEWKIKECEYNIWKLDDRWHGEKMKVINKY